MSGRRSACLSVQCMYLGGSWARKSPPAQRLAFSELYIAKQTNTQKSVGFTEGENPLREHISRLRTEEQRGQHQELDTQSHPVLLGDPIRLDIRTYIHRHEAAKYLSCFS